MAQKPANRHKVSVTCFQKTQKLAKNAKPSKGSSEVIAPKKSQQLTNEIVPPIIEKVVEAVESEGFKKETCETGGIFKNTSEDNKMRRKAILLAKQERAEMEREKFVKEMSERKAAERAEIMKQARRLILYRKPLCRRINRALLVSECLRELDAQVAFQKTIKNVDKEQDMIYANLIKAEAAKYEEEQKRKVEDEIKKNREYGTTLKKQIEENESNNKAKEKEELEAEKEDQANMNRYLQLIKEYEAEEILNKKKKLKQFFKDAIEEKKQFDLKLKYEDEFEDKALMIYRNAKARVKKIHKTIASEEKKERERKSQVIADRHRAIMKSTEAQEEQIMKRALEEQEAAEKEKEKTRKDRENAMRAAIQEYQAKYTAAKAKQIEEEKDLKIWETMQRFKRDEYNKEFESEERKRERNKKIEYASVLQKDIKEKQAEREKEKLLEDEATSMTAIVEKANQTILDYANEVVEESKDVRPLYPILKAIEECKKEMGLKPLKKDDNILPEKKSKRKRGIRRVCTKPVPEDQIYFL